jgi:hypothetical protein
MARHELERLKDSLDDVGESVGVGKTFVEGARTVYAQAREAYTAGEYRKAAELAHGADIWTHVGEHMQNAGYEGGGGQQDQKFPPRPARPPKRRPPQPHDERNPPD